ncbi:hypothetical protein STEG23_029416, partial [Scotinomys teguina]
CSASTNCSLTFTLSQECGYRTPPPDPSIIVSYRTDLRRATDFFELTLYPATLLKVFISCRSSLFIYMVYYIDRLSYVEPSLHLWDKAYLVMVDNVFDVFLESICQYFIEYLCIYVHEGDCCYISNFISDFINLDALSMPFEKVPWGAEKKFPSGRSVHWLESSF